MNMTSDGIQKTFQNIHDNISSIQLAAKGRDACTLPQHRAEADKFYDKRFEEAGMQIVKQALRLLECVVLDLHHLALNSQNTQQSAAPPFGGTGTG